MSPGGGCWCQAEWVGHRPCPDREGALCSRAGHRPCPDAPDQEDMLCSRCRAIRPPRGAEVTANYRHWHARAELPVAQQGARGEGGQSR